MKTPSLLLFASFLLLPLAGCRNRQDLASRIPGTWSLDQAQGPSPGQLILLKDGRFTATAIPSDLFDDADVSGKDEITGTGTWALRNEGDASRVGLKFENVQGVDPSHLPEEAMLSVEAGQNGTVLFFDPGDPDEDERVTFHKQTFFSNFRK